MTRAPRLLVIDPSVAFAEDACIETVLDGWPGERRVLFPSLHPGDGPAPGFGYDVDGIVVLGSRASVHDDLPWLGELGAWLRPVLDGREPVPVFGICFGHQLIAKLAGGEVGFVHENRACELGVQETRFERCKLVPEPRTLRVVASHREQVKSLPAEYRIVARRKHVPIDAFEHEALPVFGVQFHPEAREGFLEERGLEQAMDAAMVADCDGLLEAFRRLALERP